MWKYALQDYNPENMVRVVGNFLPISLKKSREIGRSIKGMKVKKAIDYLNQVIELKKPIPYKRYNMDTPHRKGKGFGPGRYPVKDSKEIIKLLNSAIKIAENKGLVVDSLIINHFVVHRAVSKESRRGRFVHLEIALKEVINEKGVNKNEKSKRNKKSK